MVLFFKQEENAVLSFCCRGCWNELEIRGVADLGTDWWCTEFFLRLLLADIKSFTWKVLFFCPTPKGDPVESRRPHTNQKWAALSYLRKQQVQHPICSLYFPFPLPAAVSCSRFNWFCGVSFQCKQTWSGTSDFFTSCLAFTLVLWSPEALHFFLSARKVLFI